MTTIIYDLSKLAPELRHEIAFNPRWRSMFSRFPDTMLRLDGNAKTIKGNARGFQTAILYLTPSDQSGVQVCPMARLALCEAPCLYTAGRGAYQSVAMGRLRKTLFLHQYREEAVAMIKRDIARFQNVTRRKGTTLLVRLNGTSDIRWENYGIIQAFPDVQFYDYTKLANRRDVPSNYDLTFSYSGAAGYLPFVTKAIEAGQRVAVVFRKRETVERMLANGETFAGLPLVDGDDTDIRHLDPQGVVVALYAKGRAKSDQSGFVVG